jgi:hypothetical protein
LKEPETFEDAYYHPNIEQRVEWSEAISKEFNEMKERKQFTRRFVSRSCLTVAHVSKIRGIQNETQQILCMSSSYWIYSRNGSGFSRSFVPVINILHSTDYDVESKKKNC